MSVLTLGAWTGKGISLWLFLPVLRILAADSMNLATTFPPSDAFTLGSDTRCDEGLQSRLEVIETQVRGRHGLTTNQTAVGLLDLRTARLAMVRPDRMFYGASVPKIIILLAWFEAHPQAATNLVPQVKEELGQMIKQSSNEMAAQYSRELGLTQIHRVIERYDFYDAAHGGGLWMGKHYGQDGERRGDPLMDHSHAATVRQLLRFYLALEQGRLVSPQASATMREIFRSPQIPHKENKFVKGLAGRDVQILRKSGTWENWFHDSAIVVGPDRHYILASLTEHPEGDAYLEALAAAVDDLMAKPIEMR